MDEWIVGLTDITEEVRELRHPDPSRLPVERVYPLPDDVAGAVGVSRV